jgi:hypothetical protein
MKASDGSPLQHPLSDKPPASSVRFTDPPSVEGTCGPQLLLEEAVPVAVPADDPDADVVVFAVCVDVLDASPGNCTGISGSVDAFPFAVPVAAPPDAVPSEDGKTDVGTLNGSDAAPPPLLAVLVWACAIEKPRRTTAKAKAEVRSIVLS